MAAENGGVSCSEKKRKKKNLNICSKLLVGEKVEVKSVEKGFEGSWHQGTVIACEDQARRVQYDHLLCIDGSNTLIRSIKVPPIIDGIIPATKTHCSYRGCTTIRPLPPPLNFDENTVHYGQCVDAYRDEAWWEGVIFDNNDGSENRLVYFPDIGNEMHFTRNNLRLTQDWEKNSGKWKPRKNWFFLDLIEEFKQEWPLQVSVKQIWFEVKEKEGFRKKLKRWTSTGYSLWRSLVWEAFSDNFKFFLDHFFKEQNLVGDKACQSPLLFSETLFVDILKPKPHLSSDVNEERKHMWLPTVSDLPEFCPDSVTEFIRMHNCKERPSVQLRQNLRKHILFLGWKIVFMKVKEILVYNYTSPEGKSYGTLLKVCENLKAVNSDLNPEPKTEEFSCNGSKYSPKKAHEKREHTWGPADPRFVPEAEFCPDAIREFKLNMETKRKPSNSLALNVRKHLSFLGWKIDFKRYNGAPKLRYTSPDGTSFVSLPKALHNLSEYNDTFAIPNQNIAKIVPDLSKEKHTSPSPNEPEYFPEAIEQYYLLGSVKNANGSTFQDPENNEVKMKAKKHLAALGWSFSYYTRRASGKRELHYTSKSGKRYASLRAACKGCMDEGAVLERKNVDEDEQPLAQLILKSKSVEVEVKDIAKVKKRGKKRRNRAKSPDSHILHLKNENVKAKHVKKRKKNTSLISIKSGGGDCTESALRSCKRSRKWAGTTLFRLIDNNVVSPKEKMHYVSKEEECQIGEKSDYICSICRYGGELILCDQCPSAFHTLCLNLQCVPDGEWFCPSCCCGICGDGRFSSDTKEFGDESVLRCDQCEHNYHVGCIRLRGVLKLENSHKENWFCNERCEQIFLGLHKLLGTPVLVGEENITWTLLKYTESSGCDQNVLDKEALSDDYSKLSVALSVMHECFEPSRERKTRRDVLEDVIFSRWSELNRLNFQGFYTVLLEKNGEVTTVATVRVHGEKVAEVPLIGTRVKYRQLGMCRMLMNELEKKLTQLGVERLVLPAVPSVLNTWTESFQFSKMTELERLNFLDYIFLDFEGTAMCQKFLRETSSPCLDHLEPKQRLVLSENNDLDEKNVDSEIFQADSKFSIHEVDLVCPVHESEQVFLKHGANLEDKVEAADQ